MHKRVKDLIKEHEGFSQHLYKCKAGKWTIGYGRNIEARGISRDEAEILLENDIRECTFMLEIHLGTSFRALSEVRKCVLIDMVYNLGIRSFLGFKRMLKGVEEGDVEAVLKEMLDSKWARQVPNRAMRLNQLYAQNHF